MTTPVFFADSLEGVAAGSNLTVEGGDAKHIRVMRIEAGERLDLVDGRGTRAKARLVESEGALVVVSIEEVVQEPEGKPRITLVQALAKSGRDELAIEMATELGVDRIIAWQSQRAIVRWTGKKREKNLDKWRNVLRAATKQARRARIPRLDFADSASNVIDLLQDDQIIVMHESASTRVSEVDQAWDGPGYALVVGPEGGITDAELDAFREAGAQVVLVGDTVMRVSTAAASGITVLNLLTGKV
ncbi:MAG: 16S rRNA (uracil(1498)-N(3))-methyltransferase [Actinomycetaceae bacterium]|nr:16S rRNA (uracil(1498)-N(3))-methyltransferase [Actinomycetaceae bacterium]